MIWTRQGYEDDAAWTAFEAYRDQTRPRKLIRPGAGATADLSRWYRENRWPERVAAYDMHMDEILLSEREALTRQAAKEIATEHMGILRDARDLVAREMAKLLATSEKSEIETLKPREVVAMVDAVIKFDRLIHDQATERVDTKVDLSGLGVEDLRKLKEIRDKVDKK